MYATEDSLVNGGAPESSSNAGSRGDAGGQWYSEDTMLRYADDGYFFLGSVPVITDRMPEEPLVIARYAPVLCCAVLCGAVL
jgi:hypothetical protein